MKNYKEPNNKEFAFTCPYCLVLSKVNSELLRIRGSYTLTFEEQNKLISKYVTVETSNITECNNCNGAIIWIDNKMIYPELPSNNIPNSDLDNDIQRLFIEANEIYRKSPRSACALLRLCLEKLCVQLGLPKNNKIVTNINLLVTEHNIPTVLQQALDYVRVIGNSAVHPNEIQESDNIETAKVLFNLINSITEQLITYPREMKEMYEKHIPQSKRDAIAIRDGITTK